MTDQEKPGRQSDMPHEALEEYLPNADGKPELYKAAGKLKGKKALITGGE